MAAGAANDNKVPSQLWIPIASISGFMACLVLFTWSRRRILLARAQRNPPVVAGTREITAEQLAGSLSRHPAEANRTARRGRTGRTPSQISTTSLPAYMKEPGEHELVIYRGPQDMEDARLPDSDDMAPADEGYEVSMHSSSSDSHMRVPQSTEPLLRNDGGPNSGIPRHPPGEGMPPPNTYPPPSSDGPSAAESVRGDAPGYFEVVDLQPPPREDQNRRSTFLGFFNRRTSTTHNLEASQSLTPPGPSHRPSYSGSSSLLRTISRKKSSNTLQSTNSLTSPSSLSVNSISSPLSHTLLRTQFYSRSTPTPEQLKLISSRDSVARFGQPYGAEAIAFAASTSRHDLDLPPPGFEDPPLSTSPLPVEDEESLQLPAPRQASEAESVSTVRPQDAFHERLESNLGRIPSLDAQSIRSLSSEIGSLTSADSFATAEQSLTAMDHDSPASTPTRRLSLSSATHTPHT